MTSSLPPTPFLRNMAAEVGEAGGGDGRRVGEGDARAIKGASGEIVRPGISHRAARPAISVPLRDCGQNIRANKSIAIKELLAGSGPTRSGRLVGVECAHWSPVSPPPRFVPNWGWGWARHALVRQSSHKPAAASAHAAPLFSSRGDLVPRRPAPPVPPVPPAPPAPCGGLRGGGGGEEEGRAGSGGENADRQLEGEQASLSPPTRRGGRGGPAAFNQKSNGKNGTQGLLNSFLVDDLKACLARLGLSRTGRKQARNWMCYGQQAKNLAHASASFRPPPHPLDMLLVLPCLPGAQEAHRKPAGREWVRPPHRLPCSAPVRSSPSFLQPPICFPPTPISGAD